MKPQLGIFRRLLADGVLHNVELTWRGATTPEETNEKGNWPERSEGPR